MNLHRFDDKTITTSHNYESDQIIMHCINWSSKRSKKLSYVPKLQTRSNNNEFASIWRQNDQKCWVTSQNIQNNAKLQNWSNYNELHRFDVKTIKNAKLQKQSNYDQFASIWRQNDKNVEIRRKTFKTTQNYESDQIIMNCIDWSSKRSKKLSNVPKLQKWSNYNELHRLVVKRIKTFESGRKITKVIKLQWIASIWCQNDQNSGKLQTRSNYDKFASIWRQNYQNVEVLRKTFKTTQNYESDQIIMNCIDWSSKRSKKLSNVPKLQKLSNYNELHRFDVKTIKKRKTTEAINLRSICIDLTSKRSKMLRYVAKLSKQHKTIKLIK